MVGKHELELGVDAALEPVAVAGDGPKFEYSGVEEAKQGAVAEEAFEPGIGAAAGGSTTIRCLWLPWDRSGRSWRRRSASIVFQRRCHASPAHRAACSGSWMRAGASVVSRAPGRPRARLEVRSAVSRCTWMRAGVGCACPAMPRRRPCRCLHAVADEHVEVRSVHQGLVGGCAHGRTTARASTSPSSPSIATSRHQFMWVPSAMTV